MTIDGVPVPLNFLKCLFSMKNYPVVKCYIHFSFLRCYMHFCSWTDSELLQTFFSPTHLLLELNLHTLIIFLCSYIIMHLLIPGYIGNVVTICFFPASTIFHVIIDLYSNHAYLDFWPACPFSGHIVSPMGLMLLQGQSCHHVCMTFLMHDFHLLW